MFSTTAQASMHPNPGGMWDRYEVGQLPNPFFTAANQFVPRSFHDVIKWSRYITTQSPTTTEVIRKLSSYPITDFLIEGDPEEDTKEKYESLFKRLKFKQKLCDFGFDHYTLGNVFLSIYYPIDRHLHCPNCKTSYEVRSAMDGGFAKWKQWQFTGVCPHCQQEVTYKRRDTKSRDMGRINLVKWNPENVAINHNPVTGESEYYYKLPGDLKRNILQGNPLFLSTVPWSIVEAVRQQKDYLFDPSNFFHMKSISMGSMLDGFGIPPLISHYNLVFYQAMLRRANEAVAAEHMTPLRAIFPQQNSQNGDPIARLSLQSFSRNVKKTMQKMKTDPNHVLISPIPIGYQAIGGQGRALLVNQELQYLEEQQLMSMGVSRELLAGSTNWTSSTIGLRLLENTMNNYVGQISEVIQWVIDNIADYLQVERHEISLIPFKLTDNEAMKQMMFELWKGKLVSGTTLLKSMGLDYNEELEHIMQDDIAAAENQIEVKERIERAIYLKSKNLHTEDDKSGFREQQDQAYQLAHNIVQMEPQQQQASLLQIRSENPSLFEMVMGILKSNGGMNGQESTGSENE